MRRCIQCKTQPARWRERDYAVHAFCGRQCQQSYYTIDLKAPEENIDDPEIVGLEASDGTRIQISVADARKMVTLESLLEDAGPDDYIPVPNIDGPTLLLIERFLRIERLELARLGNTEFFKLLRAANFLDYSRLLYYLMVEWVNRRPFPGTEFVGLDPNTIERLVSDAVYFFQGDFNQLPIPAKLKTEINRFIQYQAFRPNQWPIKKAARYGRTGIVRQLLDLPYVDPSAEKNRAFIFACEHGHIDIVQMLLETQNKGIDPADDNNVAILVAARNGHANVVRLLLDTPGRGIDPSGRYHQPFVQAASNGRANVVQLLLDTPGRGINPAANDNEAIVEAIRRGKIETVRLLLNVRGRGIDPSVRDNYAFKQAVAFGYLDVVKLLLETPGRGIDPTANDNEAIKDVVRRHRYDMVRLLLSDNRVRTPEVLEFLKKFSDNRNRW